MVVNDANIAKICVVNRSTYNERKNLNTLSETTIYFVREDYADPASCMSLYIGKARQTDLINIRNILDSQQVERFLNHDLTPGDIPSLFRCQDKIYFFENTLTREAELYMWGPEIGAFIPAASNTLYWETL